jgi:hypothetical protein
LDAKNPVAVIGEQIVALILAEWNRNKIAVLHKLGQDDRFRPISHCFRIALHAIVCVWDCFFFCVARREQRILNQKRDSGKSSRHAGSDAS